MRLARAATVLLVLALAGCADAEDPQTTPTPSVSAAPPTSDVATSEVPDPEPETAQPRGPRSVTVALTGDVLVHTGVWETAERDAAARHRVAARTCRCAPTRGRRARRRCGPSP